jgi:hypothetical protein
MACCTSVAGMLLVASKSCSVIRVLDWKKVGNIPKKIFAALIAGLT